MQNLAEEAKKKYEQRWAQLVKQKEKLFKKGDVGQWRVPGE